MADHQHRDPAPPTSRPVGGKAFPPNVEPKGQKRFGPSPQPERPTQQNVFNTDPHGRSKPGGGSR